MQRSRPTTPTPPTQPTGTLPQPPQTTWTPTIMSMAQYAPLNNDTPAQAANNTQNHTTTIHIDAGPSGNLNTTQLTAKGRVNGKIIQCLADTGSTRTLVDESILRPGARVYQTSCTAATANGAPIQVTGEANCLIEFGRQSEALVRAIVARRLTAKCILGSDYLATNEETRPGRY